MKKSDDTFSAKSEETLIVTKKISDEGDVMESQVNSKNTIQRKAEDYDAKSTADRRGLNNDRRISNGHDYTGPARRMNIDRRR